MYIVGDRILTMAGREIPEGILRIKNGKIAQVGARGEMKLEPEEGEQVLLAKNALIMPGIIEAHCHMGIMEEKKSTEGDDCNETVDPLTPALRAIDAINPMDAAFDDAVRAGITAAMIGSGRIKVPSPAWRLRPCCAGSSGRAENICIANKKLPNREKSSLLILKRSAIFRYCGERSR